MANIEFDIVVIGAGERRSPSLTDLELTVGHVGLTGIAFSRFCLDIHPESKLTILEEDTCVGGVWNACTTKEYASRQTALLTLYNDSSALQWLLVPERS